MIDTIEILQDIVSIPSYVDEKHNEYQLTEYIKNFIKQNKPDLILEEQYVAKNRNNLLVHDSQSPKTILFGHLDTVLPKEETHNPLLPIIEGDRMYGLGTVDMKSGVAIMLDVLKNHHKPGVGYILSVDEEYEFKGTFKLSEKFLLKPNLIIDLEPTSFSILNGCRGITEFNFVVHGKSTHAGLKKFGINAIEKGVEITNLLQKSISSYDSLEKGRSSLNLAFLHGGMLKGFDENGNAAISGLGMVVPNYAKINCEIRIANKKIDVPFITSELNRISSGLKTKISDLNFKFYLGSMYSPKENLISFEKAIVNAGEKVSYRDISDSGYYEVQMLQEKAGCNCVAFGPGPIEMSHSANEYVEISSIEKTQRVIETYINANHT
jgi:acetylornithine deacetylase/succinyl-diaminopimelate desuccinylase-like protein